MWELDCEESWVPKIWCFWTVVLKKTLESPLDCKEIQPSILMEISPGCSLEGLMLKLKLPYFGHLMWRADSLEKTLMLGGIGGRRRRGRQRVRWLDGNINSMDMGLSKLLVFVMDRDAWHGLIHGVAKSWTWLSHWTELNWTWAFFGIAFLWDWNENWPFPVWWTLLSFPNLLGYWVQHFQASSFSIWNSSTGIPSPPLALLIVIFSKTHLTLHSKMSGSRWVITPSWLFGSLDLFCTVLLCIIATSS